MAYLLLWNGQYEESTKLAGEIMDIEKDNQDVLFYLALYCEMYSLYYLSDKDPSDELLNWIERSCKWCLEFVKQNYPEALGDVINGIGDFIDEINGEIESE